MRGGRGKRRRRKAKGVRGLGLGLGCCAGWGVGRATHCVRGRRAAVGVGKPGPGSGRVQMRRWCGAWASCVRRACAPTKSAEVRPGPAFVLGPILDVAPLRLRYGPPGALAPERTSTDFCLTGGVDFRPMGRNSDFEKNDKYYVITDIYASARRASASRLISRTPFGTGAGLPEAPGAQHQHIQRDQPVSDGVRDHRVGDLAVAPLGEGVRRAGQRSSDPVGVEEAKCQR